MWQQHFSILRKLCDVMNIHFCDEIGYRLNSLFLQLRHGHFLRNKFFPVHQCPIKAVLMNITYILLPLRPYLIKFDRFEQTTQSHHNRTAGCKLEALITRVESLKSEV